MVEKKLLEAMEVDCPECHNPVFLEVVDVAIDDDTGGMKFIAKILNEPTHTHCGLLEADKITKDISVGFIIKE